MTSAPLEKALPYYEQVYHSIKQMIFQGVFQPGERIFEAKIARDFGVSRSPVREAVRALISDGLLVIDDKSQITVYEPDMGDVEDIYQCRMVLESLAVRLTTEKAADEELNVIKENLAEAEQILRKTLDAERNQQLISLNAEFHDLIAKFSGNQRLQKQIGDLRALAFYFRIKNFSGKNRPKVIFEEHKKVFELMKQRDDKKAALMMEEHITNDLEHYKKFIIS